MMNMDINYIASAVGGRLSPTSDGTRIINGFFSDSRKAEKDKLFLAIRGEKVDGNSFVPSLVSNGCCAMCDNPEYVPDKGTVIMVDDVRTALQNLAEYYRDNELSNVKLVGITGSVGKTTTKDMIALALSGGIGVYKTEGNANSQIGLPQTVLACDQSYDCAVVELGMSMPGEMERIARCAKPDISVITNIGYSHIENLGSREAIRNEKLKISSFSAAGSSMILNGDEELLRNIDTESKQVFYASVSDRECDCFAENIVESDSGVSFVASVFGNKVNVNLPVKGSHFVINSLFALAASSLLGVELVSAAEMLSQYKSDGKRQYIYESDGHTVISDCYNASPESMKAALSVLKSSCGRRIAVLGDMLELGDISEELHKRVGTYVHDSADILVTYGDMAKFIAETAELPETYSFDKGDSEKLKKFLSSLIKKNDTVLYKASNGMKLNEVIV